MCMNGRVRCTESASPIREGYCPNLLHGYCPRTAKAEGQGREVARIACHEIGEGGQRRATASLSGGSELRERRAERRPRRRHAVEATADGGRARRTAGDGVADVEPRHVDGAVIAQVGERVTRGADVGRGLEGALPKADAGEGLHIDVDAEVPRRADEPVPQNVGEGRPGVVAAVVGGAGEHEVGRPV